MIENRNGRQLTNGDHTPAQMDADNCKEQIASDNTNINSCTGVAFTFSSGCCEASPNSTRAGPYGEAIKSAAPSCPAPGGGLPQTGSRRLFWPIPRRLHRISRSPSLILVVPRVCLGGEGWSGRCGEYMLLIFHLILVTRTTTRNIGVTAMNW